RAVDRPVGDRLVRADRLAEGGALLRVRDGKLDGTTGRPDRAPHQSEAQQGLGALDGVAPRPRAGGDRGRQGHVCPMWPGELARSRPSPARTSSACVAARAASPKRPEGVSAPGVATTGGRLPSAMPRTTSPSAPALPPEDEDDSSVAATYASTSGSGHAT